MIKRKALFLTGILLVACIGVTGYQFKDRDQMLGISNPILNSTNPDINDSNKSLNPESSDKLEKSSSDQSSKNSSRQSSPNYDSQSIAQKYIEEEGAVAGKPKRIKIGDKETDVVPVLSNSKQVGEIHIDPETGENVGGAGGAPE
jgi:hypothetical protein